ncbi:hypothetical protein JRG49_06560 [Pseudomonas fulva]|uniref:hypothetical protein n=1 Tax=Pseudomonas TaxID=286 RepID=UPI0019D225B3|nr:MULTISPECIES: hypothetical protein [Pseudomonas]MCY4125086.1 hypothetical protein [Pseudomonas sp.]MBN6789901.1 hypothetical protein [Pseudomonas fulva]MBN6794871.1 hypothetical protein [Pseudomonas fulva]MBN6855310.1 hypothetical protein [Pseudomonas fulva]MBN6872493.1 hypothetical protein [Pseudomonas fulva]
MPTENRSSNTEMVSAPREPSAQMLDAARNAPVPMVYVDSMRARQDLEFSARYKAAISQCTQPAPQPHPDPIAWMVGTAFWWTKVEAERDAAATGLPIVGLGPMTDTAEAERLFAANTEFARRHLEGLAEVERLRAHLAEALRVASQAHLALISYLPAHRNAVTTAAIEACAALSASAERRAPIAWHVGGNGYDRICFEMPAELPGHPCIQPIHDQRQLIDLLKRYDLRDEDVPPDERVHGISGTSFQRLNALANQGE